MAVDRLSVTLPARLGSELRALAETRGTTVSALISDAVAHQIRLAALDKALAEADRRFGRLADEDVDAAEAELLRPRHGRPSRKRVARKRAP